jgi:hypothetical protein
VRCCGLSIVAFLAPVALPAADAPAAPVSVAAVVVEPASAGPATLCKLSVRLANGAERPIGSLVFGVRLNGRPVGAYENRTYLVRLEPGRTSTLELYNFWSTESGRPAPADGVLTVEVTLSEARYFDGEREAVAGLPSTATARVPFRAAP